MPHQPSASPASSAHSSEKQQISGFICPHCVVQLPSAEKLQAHWLEFHVDEADASAAAGFTSVCAEDIRITPSPEEDLPRLSDDSSRFSNSHDLDVSVLRRPRSCRVCHQIVWSEVACCRRCTFLCHLKCVDRDTSLCKPSGQQNNRRESVLLAGEERAPQPDGARGLVSKVRHKVAQGRARYMDEAFDLDMSYITERIIAMSFPSKGLEATYRNNLNDVARMLKMKHRDSYMVFNVSERSYDVSKLNNQVLDFGWPDHLAPPLDRLCCICKSIDSWLASDAQNVVVVHCKGGKGRTGVVIAAYMHYSNQHDLSAEAALNLFAMKRFYDERCGGVTQPSQRRYVMYFESLLKGDFVLTKAPIYLKFFIVHGTPNFDGHGSCRPYFRVYQDLKLVYTSPVQVFNNDTKRCRFVLDEPLMLHGDILVRLFHRRPKTGHDIISRCQFHTCAIADFRLVLSKLELDEACLDKRFPENARIEFIFEPPNVDVGDDATIRTALLVSAGKEEELTSGSVESASSNDSLPSHGIQPRKTPRIDAETMQRVMVASVEQRLEEQLDSMRTSRVTSFGLGDMSPRAASPFEGLPAPMQPQLRSEKLGDNDRGPSPLIRELGPDGESTYAQARASQNDSQGPSIVHEFGPDGESMYTQVRTIEDGDRSPSPLVHDMGPDGQSTYAQVMAIILKQKKRKAGASQKGNQDEAESIIDRAPTLPHRPNDFTSEDFLGVASGHNQPVSEKKVQPVAKGNKQAFMHRPLPSLPQRAKENANDRLQRNVQGTSPAGGVRSSEIPAASSSKDDSSKIYESVGSESRARSASAGSISKVPSGGNLVASGKHSCSADSLLQDEQQMKKPAAAEGPYSVVVPSSSNRVARNANKPAPDEGPLQGFKAFINKHRRAADSPERRSAAVAAAASAREKAESPFETLSRVSMEGKLDTPEATPTTSGAQPTELHFFEDHWSDCSQQSEKPAISEKPSATATKKFWYRPALSREACEAALDSRPVGSFLVRDSVSMQGGYGLCMRTAPHGRAITKHYLLEPASKPANGVHLRMTQEMPYASLDEFIDSHVLSPLALPCRLILPRSDWVADALKEKQPATVTPHAAIQPDTPSTSTKSPPLTHATASPSRKPVSHAPVFRQKSKPLPADGQMAAGAQAEKMSGSSGITYTKLDFFQNSAAHASSAGAPRVPSDKTNYSQVIPVSEPTVIANSQSASPPDRLLRHSASPPGGAAGSRRAGTERTSPDVMWNEMEVGSPVRNVFRAPSSFQEQGRVQMPETFSPPPGRGGESGGSSSVGSPPVVGDSAFACEITYLGSATVSAKNWLAAMVGAYEQVTGRRRLKAVSLFMSVSTARIKLRDNYGKQFKFAMKDVAHCGLDPYNRKFWMSQRPGSPVHSENRPNSPAQGRLVFGIIVNKSDGEQTVKQTCHLFAECEGSMPASSVVEQIHLNVALAASCIDQ